MKDSILHEYDKKLLRDARDEWREAYLREEAENKRLRDLLISHLINPDEGKEPEE